MVIARDRERRPTTYAPRGAEVQAWRWERVANVPET